MSTGYQLDNPAEPYFLTLTVVDWVDIFSRKIYRDIMLDSLAYCRAEKGLQVWGYRVMTNHVHCILRAKNGNLPDILRDMKRHTASKIIKAIASDTESRSDWMLKRFEFAARKNSRDSFYQFWQHNNHAEVIKTHDLFCQKLNYIQQNNHAEIILTHEFFCQKLNYIHQNPVRAGWVDKPEDWLYGSMRNYLGMPGLIEIDVSDF